MRRHREIMGQLYILLALAIGLLLPIQVGINTELAQRISSPVTASFFSFAVGTIGLMICLWVSTRSLARLKHNNHSSQNGYG